ncbi:zinc finger lsd1 subclass family protein (macronuclear) [Tetrahymena thermophila SB210]|uniref:Zinc finger lsd1 subclass family protein n=1 Tax=Tetrahymena thermophila (strain SB210) TaxID=312017 RepID=Q23QI0_TETTS|nr:zinc finger lsd1 subclass family protein [Tetrahymena thermophila SB210]EAR98908.3 zinc finger lsd1 subclass family protein [Tetrahymena thermophila SB210]|eukprot:XP_001019153.3 zinc finger lsd1 subclass family protein [Tetrahymena thermophila SB210]
MKYSLQLNILFSSLFALISFTQAEEVLIAEEFKAYQFSSNDVVGWNQKTVKLCEQTSFQDFSKGNMFGVFAKETPNLQKIYQNLPPHWSLSVRVDVLLYKSVDNEKVNVVLDGTTYKTYQKDKYDGVKICLGSTSYNDQLYFFQKNITHTNSQLNLQFTSNFDQDNSDEGFGIKNLSVRVDTCHPSCATCSGPSQNQCQSCPNKGTLQNGACTCPSMGIAHNYQCLNQCPQGFQPDSTNSFCVETFCNPSKCSKCDSNGQSCSQCANGYYQFRKGCVQQCPSFAPQQGQTCQDPSKSTPNGDYLLIGLNSNNFGESEIAALGLQLSNFNQATFGNCGSVQLLGGPFIGGKGSQILKTFQNIKPHFQVRFGFQYYQIDSWDSEGFKVYVDTNQIDEIKQDQAGGKDNLCGSNSWKDNFYSYSKSIQHNSQSLEIKLNATFDEDYFNESFGIRELFVIVDYCPPGCASCDSNQCFKCFDGYQKSGTKCVNTCADDEFSLNKVCNKCDSTCKSCKDTAQFCTSCNSGRYLYQNQCLEKCPDNYFNNSLNNMCSQCSIGDCPLCLPPGYSSSCKNCSGLKIISNKCPK